MVQKVRRQEQGHEYAERLLLGLGAAPIRADADPRAWLREALEAVGAQNLRHRGVHRYVYRLGKSRRERESIRLGLSAGDPYPKVPDSLWTALVSTRRPRVLVVDGVCHAVPSPGRPRPGWTDRGHGHAAEVAGRRAAGHRVDRVPRDAERPRDPRPRGLDFQLGVSGPARCSLTVPQI